MIIGLSFAVEVLRVAIGVMKLSVRSGPKSLIPI